MRTFEKAGNNLFEIITQTSKTLKRFAVRASFRREYDEKMRINFCDSILFFLRHIVDIRYVPLKEKRKFNVRER